MWKPHTVNTSPHDIPSCFCPFVPSLYPYNFSRKFLFFSSVCAFGVLCASHPQTESSRFLDNSHNSPHCLSSPCTLFRTTMCQSCSLIPFHPPVGKVCTVCTGHKHNTQHIHAHYDTHNYMHAYRHTHTHTHTSMHLSCCLCRFRFLYWRLQ